MARDTMFDYRIGLSFSCDKCLPIEGIYHLTGRMKWHAIETFGRLSKSQTFACELMNDSWTLRRVDRNPES